MVYSISNKNENDKSKTKPARVTVIEATGLRARGMGGMSVYCIVSW